VNDNLTTIYKPGYSSKAREAASKVANTRKHVCQHRFTSEISAAVALSALQITNWRPIRAAVFIRAPYKREKETESRNEAI
jgi:hypothetical protein